MDRRRSVNFGVNALSGSTYNFAEARDKYVVEGVARLTELLVTVGTSQK